VFAATIVFLRDYRLLERYRYTIALAGIVLLLLPRVPGISAQVNGAYLGVQIGPVSFQPAELSKICLIVFLASYLRDTRQVMQQKVRLKDLGPLLVIWGASMVLLVFIRDLGSSLMFFGGFLALVYVATSRISFVAIGLAMFAGGAAFFTATVGHVQGRIDAWQEPFRRDLYEAETGGSYQIAQSLFAQADGGLFGTGFGQAFFELPSGARILPARRPTSSTRSSPTSSGSSGRGAHRRLPLHHRARLQDRHARDGLVLQAAGDRADRGLRLQVFVIVGGVTKLIPLTGVTLPFVSYGGSSIVANFILLACC
jgi:cell division protein FtsW (lipid II flippase)